MGWDEVCEKHRHIFNSDYFICGENREKETLRDIIIEEFPQLSGPKVDEAIGYCCAATRAPRLKMDFVKCVSKQLSQGRMGK